jgi:hypothetical protein
MKENRIIVSLPKSFKEKYVGKHAAKDIIKTYKKCEEQDNLLAKKDEEIATLKAQKNKPDTAEPIQESKHLCGFYCLDGNGKVDCLKFYDEKGTVRQIPKEVCDHHFAFMQGAIQSKKEMFKKDIVIAGEFPCRCRFDQEDEWFCALNAPTVRKLEYSSKTCQACPKRLTEEKVKELDNLKTDRYVTCGAKITEDSKAGLLVWDSKDPTCLHQGQAYPLNHCFSIKCPKAKIVQYTTKK